MSARIADGTLYVTSAEFWQVRRQLDAAMAVSIGPTHPSDGAVRAAIINLGIPPEEVPLVGPLPVVLEP
jgi:hypothetical protein